MADKMSTVLVTPTGGHNANLQPGFHYESPGERRQREAAEARSKLAAEERQKQEERERKKAEVRKRLEEAAKAKKGGGKKGFMTPERKKKLRTLLRKKAAEELKREQERKAEERKRCIAERCGPPKPLDNCNEATLQAICREYHKRITALEDVKFDLEYEVRQKEHVINELNSQVNDLRGKFVKPPLKKVSKYDGKFEKLNKLAKSTEMNYRAQLKSTKKKTLDEEVEKEKPEWALGKAKAGGEGGGE